MLELKREHTLARLHEHITNEKTILHCLASEAVMRALARRLGEDPDCLGMTSLSPPWRRVFTTMCATI